jgi:DNA-binding MarR family transcriptional regulator
MAELRYRIRQILREADAAAHAADLEPQQYLMLLAIRGLPRGDEATIRTLADRVALKHHSTVEPIDRLEKHGYMCRRRGRDDRCLVMVSLLPRGQRVLATVARHRISELRSNGRQLVHAINQLLEHKRHPRNDNRQRKSPKRRG